MTTVLISLLTNGYATGTKGEPTTLYKMCYLAERAFGKMKHLGDITKIHGDQIEPVDCITFGSPCQDLSIAGKRLGFDGNRSVLFLDAARIIKEMRKATNGMYPTFAVWENVPGAFSSNGGEDFRTVLEELARIAQPDVSIPRPSGRGGRWSKAGAIAGNGWSLAWRQLDAQYWGVPQRRKRIALVVDFGGQRAPEILFERTSLSGNPDESIPTWKSVAGLAKNCAAGNDRVVGAGYFCNGDGKAGCGRAEADGKGKGKTEERASGDKCCEAAAYSLKIRSGCAGGGKGALVQTEKVGTLSTLQDQTLFQPVYCLAGNIIDRSETAGANGLGVKENQSYTLNTIDRPAVAYSINSLASNSMKSANPHSGFNETNVSRTLDCSDQNPAKNQGGLVIVQASVFDARGNGDGKIVPTITGSHEHYKESDKCSTLKAKSGNIGNGSECLIAEKTIRWIVRRLTPVECERLQGFSDGYTDIGDWTDSNGKKHKYADSPRYKALGNSIALPQWFWLVQKMRPYLKEKPTLGSLFDGLGGFPLVWQTAYGDGTARWASEIEEFPMAVTKRRFGEE